MVKNEKQSDPSALAEQFLTYEGGQTVRRWREEYYCWESGRYLCVSNDTVSQEITRFLQKRVAEDANIVVSNSMVRDVTINLNAMIHIDEKQEFNSFLDGEDRGRFLCMKNGLLNIENRELVPHTPNYFSVVRLPYDYDPGATCPRWKAFIAQVTRNRGDYAALLQEWFGYLFTPDLRYQKFLLCVGEGANGKGVMFEVTQSIVGVENCSQVPISRFGNKFALNSTKGKVVNLTHESSQVLEDDAENVLKSYVAGDTMTIDRKYRDPVNLKPTAKLMISTNTRPRFNDQSQAVWRRILYVPFDFVVDEKDQDKDLAEKLNRESSGILNWSLVGLDRLNRQGFTEPQGQKELMEEYRRDADPARAYLKEHYATSSNGEFLACSDVYKNFTEWCQSNGCRATNERTFGQDVRRIFPTVDRRYMGSRGKREYVYQGLSEIL